MKLKLEDLKIPRFDFKKNGMEGYIIIDNDKAIQALYYSNIKDKETRATFKSGKVIEVKTISNRDAVRRIRRECLDRKLALFCNK